MKQIKIFQDGPNFKEIKDFYEKVDGYTFNPSLFKKLGARNYLEFTSEILKYTGNKSVSIEIFADNEKDCFEQALKINSINKNIVVKIPISYTNGKSTINLIKRLITEKINLNITAIFTIEQVKYILSEIRDTNTILSIFSGRLFDIGLNASEIFSEISSYVHKNSSCRTLWASCRIAYDYELAKKSDADIITMPTNLISKLDKFGYSPLKCSADTVKMFFEDAKKSNFKI